MAYIWRETFSNIKHSGLISVFSIMIVALTTIVFGTLLIIANYLHIELDILKKSPFVVAFLEDGIEDSQRENIQKKIESLPQVSSVRYVSKRDALRRTAEMFAGRKEILEGLEKMNPLPSSFEIEVHDKYLNDVKELANTIENYEGVDDVQHAEEASRLVKSIETTMIIIGSILGLASIIIIYFSIMLTAYMRREEIRIMRLVGSTRAFIRLPLLLQGIVQGLLGSALGLAILYGLFNLYGTFKLLVANIDPTIFLSLNEIGLIIGIGAFIGLVGGAVPMRKFIKL